MTVAPNPVLIHRSRLPFRYPRRSLLRWYGPAANTSASSASANFNITSRTLPRNASLNRSGPKRPSIWLKHCILFPIGVFLLGLTLPMSQILFWDTERIRLLYFPQQAGRLSYRLNAALHIAFPISRQGRHTEVVISELNTWPVGTPVNASPASLRIQAHDSGPRSCATPFLFG